MSALASFAGAVAALSYDRLEGEVVDAARRRVFDTLGATVIGLALPDGRALRELTDALTPPGGQAGLTDAIRLYTGATRTTEIDDINIVSCTTVGSVVVPVALAAASQGIAGVERVIEAIVAGYEAMVRLGTAIDGAEVMYKGVWPTYVTAPFAAAAAGAKLLRLDADQTANALSLALARTTGLQGRAAGGIAPRAYVLGCAAADGFVAAQAAATGISCDASILEAYARSLGVEVNEARLARDLDAMCGVLQVDTKTFPSARQSVCAIEAFEAQLPLPHPIEDIERVEVYVPAQYRAMIGRVRMPRDRIESLLSVAYQMALVALDDEALYDPLRTNLRDDDAVRSFVHKVQVLDDGEFTAAFSSQWPGRVRIVWRSGAATTTEVRVPAGGASQPLDWEGLSDRLQRILAASGAATSVDASSLLACRYLGEDPEVSAGRFLEQAALLSDLLFPQAVLA